MVIRYACDKCGAAMTANDSGRFIVKMEVFAADGPIDLTASTSDDPQREISEVLDALARSDPDDMEDRTYRSFRFDVCDRCRQILLAKPLGTD